MKKILAGEEVIRVYEVPIGSLVLFEFNDDVFKWDIPVHSPFNLFTLVAFGGCLASDMYRDGGTYTWDKIMSIPTKNKYLFDSFEELCKFIYEKI